MYKLKIVLLISLQLLCSCLFYSEEIFHFDFHNDVNLKKTDVKNFLESSSSLNFNLITFDELEALNKYDAIQVYNIVKNKEPDITNRTWAGAIDYIYKENSQIEVNEMKLTKILIYMIDYVNVYPGFCVYVNLDDSYNLHHTFINKKVVQNIFDENGKRYFLIKDYYGFQIYPAPSFDIIDGGLYDYYYTRLFINYIDENSKQVMFYDIYSGKSGTVLQLPPLYKPELYWGFDTKELDTLGTLGLVPVKTENKVNEKGFVYRQVIDGRDWEGHVYKRDTLYLIDYNLDGTRKKGIYKLMGDTFEFYPDL